MKVLLTFVLAATGLAETHRFEPKEFYNTFSGAYVPVLRIKPGDKVVTYTIDARGIDSKGVQRGRGPNPETGPFYIEGAEPGDTLVVHLLRLETNRATGFSASLLAPYTADPGFLRLEALREPKMAIWHIDKKKGVVVRDNRYAWFWRRRAATGFPKGFRGQYIGIAAAKNIVNLLPAEIVKYFRDHPQVAENLVTESYDKRYSPSTFIKEDGTGFSFGWYSTKLGYECVREFSHLAYAATDYLLFSRGKGR